ncbi:MAG: hypothetical protein JWM87_3013 [Candidatus Eremiobacteraeota bacterium]|nr:hypothetical protein [Candidatus Eremiobacteraeota bacterium]
MRVPTDEELAAIAVAYLAVTRRDETAPRAEASRWALAGRLPLRDVQHARFAARAGSRWNAAGRLDG